ncbi:calcium-binding protein [Halovulum sp. GXIMD14794]
MVTTADFEVYGPHDFRAALEFIDGLAAAERDGFEVFYTVTGVLERSIFDTPTGTLTVDIWDRESGGSTDFFFANLGGTTNAWILQTDELLDFAGGLGLTPLFEAAAFPDTGYTSFSSGARIRAYGTDDRMDGEGWMHGGAGDDYITLEDNFTTERGDGGKSVGIGGAGNDVLLTELARSVLKGGKGDDLITVSAGKARVVGGEGADLFAFNNGNSDFTEGPEDDTPVRAGIRDFDGAEDMLVFSVNVYNVAPFPGDLGTLAEAFGPGTLADLDTFTLTRDDGLSFDYAVGEDATGNAVIRREGIWDHPVNTKVYDEKVTLHGLGLNEVDLATVWVDSDFL